MVQSWVPPRCRGRWGSPAQVGHPFVLGFGHDVMVAFDRLLTSFRVTSAPTPGGTAEWPFAQVELDEVFESLGGVCLDEGLYRVHTPASAIEWAGAIAEEFPTFQGRALPFGFDWLGRQFATDRDRTSSSGHLCLLLEPGTGEALELPYTVVELHQSGLIDQADAALAVGFYRSWRHDAEDIEALLYDECVGYRVPLFLGGADETSNLERTDMAVYWSLVGQMFVQSAVSPPGTPVSEVRRER